MKLKFSLPLVVVSAALVLAVGAVFLIRSEASDQSRSGSLLGNLGESGESIAPEPTAPNPKETPDPAAVVSGDGTLPSLEWLHDPELDDLRMEVYKAELKARHLKALLDIRDYEKRLSGKPAREEAPKPVTAPPKPKPKLKLVALDGSGALIDIDGRMTTFAKVGDRQGRATLTRLGPDRAVVEIDGDELEAKF